MNQTASNNEARQSNNPDIQDIITGIVKLLNGNVNVHANTQGTRRPLATRINNRGPPRINDAQVPNDSEQQQQLTTQSTIPTKSSPPYPFDRGPEGPIRPFLTGVPLPEQIVPSMQQNYRPGFISQNRPPWQRPRPRPPINANRRPIPPYRPLPSLPTYKPEMGSTFNHNINATKSSDDTIVSSNIAEEDIYDSDGIDSTEYELDIDNSVKKDQLTKNKKTKIAEKKQEINDSGNSKVIEISPTAQLTTIIHSTSEINTVQFLESNNFLTGSEEFNGDMIQPSLVEDFVVNSASYNKTPDMTTELLVNHNALPTATPQNLPVVRPTASNGQNQSIPYHPRPGLVLDDPEFKPGGQKSKTRPQQHQNLPPGYGEIFDITLSAIQGPGGGSSQQQTVNIKPYGSYEGSDLILSPSGDQGFVLFDGKRSYINLFGDATDEPANISPSTIAKQIKPTQVLSPGVTGSGYVVAETEPPVNQHSNKFSQQRPNQRPRPAIPKPPPVR